MICGVTVFILFSLHLQSFTEYLILALVGVAHYGKGLIFVFLGFLASINKMFIFSGGLSTRLSFY